MNNSWRKSIFSILSRYYTLMLTMGLFNVIFVESAICGECLESRKEMLEGYRQAIIRVTEHPDNRNISLGDWIERCWCYSDPNYPNSELDDELGSAILETLRNPAIPDSIKLSSLGIAENAAPINLFFGLIKDLDQNRIPFKKEAVKVILAIWVRYSSTKPEIANYDYPSLLRKYMPNMFEPPYPDLYYFNWVLSRVYPFDYLKPKKMLVDMGLFQNVHVNLIHYSDPRAIEDSGYYNAFPKGTSLFHERMFFALANHLELEFKEEWLKNVRKYHLRLLRNGILVTYGYELKDKKLDNWFRAYKGTFCRNGTCGIVNKMYNPALLNEIDKNNIALIRHVEASFR